MLQSFVGTIVHIYQQGLPSLGKGLVVNGIAVVLAGDEAVGGAVQAYGLVVSAVAVLQLIYARACGNAQ